MQTYTIPEVAEILKCGEDTARNIILRLPHCRVGYEGSMQGMIRISEETLRAYINGEMLPRQDPQNYIEKRYTKKQGKDCQLIPNKRPAI